MRTEPDYQTFEQPIVRNNAELGFEILKNRVNDASRRHIQRDEPPSTVHRGSTMMSNRLLEGGREPMKQKEISTIAEFIAARREVERIVKQEKRNKEFSIARICKHNPKSCFSYINERRIVRDNIGPLKILDGLLSQPTMTWPTH